MATSVHKCELARAAQYELEQAEVVFATVEAVMKNELEKVVAQSDAAMAAVTTNVHKYEPQKAEAQSDTARVAETTNVHKYELVDAVLPMPRRGRGGRRGRRCSARGRV